MKIKGTHNALKSGILAGESIYEKHMLGSINGLEINEYEQKVKDSWVFNLN